MADKTTDTVPGKVFSIRMVTGMLLLISMFAACEQTDEGSEVGADGTGDGEASGGAAADSSLASGGVDTVGVSTDRVLVETTPARRGRISNTLPFSATLETEAAVAIFPRIGGLVDRVDVEEGDEVAEGAALLFIEDDELEIAVREAQVSVRRLLAQFDRTEEMHKRELVSEQDYENARFELDQGRLVLERAKLNLRHAVVRAPFAGVIAARSVQKGERVDLGRQLFDLVKFDEMIAKVYVPAQNLGTINPGQRAVIVAELQDSLRFEGWVKRVSPVVDPGSGTFKVTVGLAARNQFLRPGMFVGVEVVVDTRDRAILIPKQAVVYDGGTRYVFSVHDSIANRVRLHAGYENSSDIEARSGIAAGDEVIVLGHNGLADGARVRTAEVSPTASVVSPEPAPGVPATEFASP